jgi:hypothetical protein
VVIGCAGLPGDLRRESHALRRRGRTALHHSLKNRGYEIGRLRGKYLRRLKVLLSDLAAGLLTDLFDEARDARW